MPRKRQYPEFGSVSSGTMRTDDLLSAFEYECRTWGGKRGKKLAREYSRMTEEQVSGEEGDGLLEEMFDLLNEVAPPHGYFGGHPGDGADYGFWLSESWEDAIRYGDAIKVGDLADIPKGYRGEVFHVNDRGNVTLYIKSARKLTEIWGVV